jgi:hypothetical protein
MSLTKFLEKKLGISLQEASLVEKQVKGFTSIVKKNKITESYKRKFREEDEEQLEDMSMDDEGMSMEDDEMSMEDDEMSMDDEDMSMDDSLMINGEYADNEVEMIKIQLKSIVSNAESLMNTLDNEQNLDAWIQSKITLAQDYLASAHDYIVYSDTYSEEDSDLDEMPMDEEPVEEMPMDEEPESLPAPVESPEVKESFKYGFVSF